MITPFETDFGSFLSLGIKGLFFVLVLAFALQAIVLTYHWFAYGSNRTISMLALGVYLGGGAVLLVTFAISLTAF